MSRGRESTTPMDYEWQDNKGPVDPKSPWITAVPQQQPIKKRSHTALESPSKNIGFSTPNRPQLREPHNERYLFSQQSKSQPSIPVHFQPQSPWQPRTPSNIVDCSSGGETPNTPGFNDDSDAATPDTQFAHKMGRLMEGDTEKSPKKGRRSFLGTLFKSKSSSILSPTKEESAKYYSKKAENRVVKRRAKSRKAIVRDEYDSDTEMHDSASNPMPQAQEGMAVGAAAFFHWIEAHPNLPSVLSFYLQLLVNLFLGFAFMYVLYAAWCGIMNDVNLESQKSMVEIMVEIGACAKDYTQNRCAPETRVPHMEMVCNNWEKCMQRDPKKVARASVTARTFAMIFNSFVEEFSYKSMIFTVLIIFGGFNLSNWAFGLIRQKTSPHQYSDGYNYPPPPATPQRQPSGAYIDYQQQWQTPYQSQTPYGGTNKGMLQQASQSMPTLQLTEKDDRRSPSKRSRALA
ncbi:hypothetical protein K504DRAFT_464331 [Pleomassaria siparia CBS 279.74]|uniref:Brl1/Brr6 domain-containing protein n=1 Tax=Pleomassaria siparia CBS 279.74 TaxID=1314801 RepID=A0A6G1KIM0_9PLEO|nr:hypothetical protein K504DRAFT_464331 [Pleomassaria siparia CBS 279.74]